MNFELRMQSDLDEIIRFTTDKEKITPERLDKIAELVETIEEELNDELDKDERSIRLDIIGSSKNGFGMNNADVDICLRFGEEEPRKRRDYKVMIEFIGETLKQLKMFENKKVGYIIETRVPIVEFEYENIEGDICYHNILALHNTRMLKKYCEWAPRILPALGMFVKKWAKSVNIGYAARGTLSSYAFILLTIHYLQRTSPPVLPILQEQFDNRRVEHPRAEGWDVYFHEEVVPDWSMNTQTLAEHFLGFLDYYTKFDWDTQVVQIRRSAPLGKKEKDWDSLMCIEDPFEREHNLASRIDWDTFVFLMKTLQRSCTAFMTPLVRERMQERFEQTDIENQEERQKLFTEYLDELLKESKVNDTTYGRRTSRYGNRTKKKWSESDNELECDGSSSRGRDSGGPLPARSSPRETNGFRGGNRNSNFENRSSDFGGRRDTGFSRGPIFVENNRFANASERDWDNDSGYKSENPHRSGYENRNDRRNREFNSGPPQNGKFRGRDDSSPPRRAYDDRDRGGYSPPRSRNYASPPRDRGGYRDRDDFGSPPTRSGGYSDRGYWDPPSPFRGNSGRSFNNYDRDFNNYDHNFNNYSFSPSKFDSRGNAFHNYGRSPANLGSAQFGGDRNRDYYNRPRYDDRLDRGCFNNPSRDDDFGFDGRSRNDGAYGDYSRDRDRRDTNGFRSGNRNSDFGGKRDERDDRFTMPNVPSLDSRNDGGFRSSRGGRYEDDHRYGRTGFSRGPIFVENNRFANAGKGFGAFDRRKPNDLC